MDKQQGWCVNFFIIFYRLKWSLEYRRSFYTKLISSYRYRSGFFKLSHCLKLFESLAASNFRIIWKLAVKSVVVLVNVIGPQLTLLKSQEMVTDRNGPLSSGRNQLSRFGNLTCRDEADKILEKFRSLRSSFLSRNHLLNQTNIWD